MTAVRYSLIAQPWGAGGFLVLTHTEDLDAIAEFRWAAEEMIFRRLVDRMTDVLGDRATRCDWHGDTYVWEVSDGLL